MSASSSRLCYLEAANVIGPTGQLASMSVRSLTGAPLGTVAGVLIEPERRRLRFLVVRAAAAPQRQYVVPIDAASRLQRAEGTLTVEADDLTAWAVFDRRTVDEFTEADAVAPTFHKYLGPQAVPGQSSGIR